jgi:hypothetical protein
MEADSDLSVHPTQGKEFTPPPSGPKSQNTVMHQFSGQPAATKKRNKRKKLKARMQPETNLTKDYAVTKQKGKGLPTDTIKILQLRD